MYLNKLLFRFCKFYIIKKNCISSEEVNKNETLHAIRIPKKVIQDFIKYNTDVMFSFLSYYSPKDFKTLKFGSNKFEHPVLKLELQNSEADHADVDIEFKEYPQNTIQVTFKNLILNIVDKGSKDWVQIKVVWLSFKFDVMKSIFRPFENIVNHVTWKIDAKSLRFVSKRNERTSELSINQRNEIDQWIEDTFTSMKTDFKEFGDIISDMIQRIQKSYDSDNKLLEDWNEINVSSDNILISLVFKKDATKDNYSYLTTFNL